MLGEILREVRNLRRSHEIALYLPRRRPGKTLDLVYLAGVRMRRVGSLDRFLQLAGQFRRGRRCRCDRGLESIPLENAVELSGLERVIEPCLDGRQISSKNARTQRFWDG